MVQTNLNYRDRFTERSLASYQRPESSSFHLAARIASSYIAHKADEYEWQQVNILTGRQELLLSTLNPCKLSWFGHVYRHDTLPKIILRGTVASRRRRGSPRK